MGSLYAAFTLILAVILVPIGLITSVMGAADSPELFGGGIGLVIIGVLAPIVYGIMGFIGGVLCALLYNVIAKFTGGLEFTVEDIQPSGRPAWMHWKRRGLVDNH